VAPRTPNIEAFTPLDSSATVRLSVTPNKAADFAVDWPGVKAFVEVKRSSGFADELAPAGELLRAVKVMDQELAGQHVTVWASDDFHERRLTSDLRSDRLRALQAQLASWLVSSRRSPLVLELKLGQPVDLAEGFLFAHADDSGNGVSTRPFASAEDHGLNLSMSSVSGLSFVLIQARTALPQLYASAETSTVTSLLIPYTVYEAWELVGVQIGGLAPLLEEAFQWDLRLGLIVQNGDFERDRHFPAAIVTDV
jgi:hypothetical protein